MIFNRLNYFKANNRVIFARIGTDNKYTVAVAYFGDGVGHCPATEGCGQTGHGGRMSETGTVVNIIGADDRPGEFLEKVVLFVGTLGRGKKAQ